MATLRFSHTTPAQQEQLRNLAAPHEIYAELSSDKHTITFYGMEPGEIDPIAGQAISLLGPIDVEANGEPWGTQKP